VPLKPFLGIIDFSLFLGFTFAHLLFPSLFCFIIKLHFLVTYYILV
jgi:hypothetical protein